MSKNIQKKTIEQVQANQAENKIELTPVIPETDIDNLIKEDELAQEKSDNILINENNIFSALLILLGSTCYVIGGVLTLKISKKKNENVTSSILIWAVIILIPIVSFAEQPWNINPRLDSTISVMYLGLVSTGIAWLLRFKILVKNGLIFQSQVSYLIPIFGTILSYIFLKELITFKVLISLIAVSVGIYFVRKAGDNPNKIRPE